jgi:hypothetical protein
MAMFEQTFVVTAKTRKMGTVLVSFAAETILVAIGILIPMVWCWPLRLFHPRLLRPYPRLLELSSLFRVRLTPAG